MNIGKTFNVNFALIKFLFFVNLFFFSSAAHCLQPSECEDRDFSHKFGPVENQVGLGWCYAYTAIDLINFSYSDELNGVGLSPGSLATEFNNTFLRKDTSGGGFVKLAIENAADFGVCPRELVEGQFNSNYPFSYIADGLNLIKERLENKPDYASKLAMINKYKSEDFLPQGMSSEVFLNIIEKAETGKVATSLINYLCENNKFYPKKYNVESTGSFVSGIFKGIFGQDYIDLLKGREYKLKKLSKIISSGNIAGISVHSDFLREDITPPIWVSHSLTVVGQKWNSDKNSCEYIVRNSWGDDCYMYKPEIKKTCNKGYIVIDEKTLQNKLISVIWLEKNSLFNN